MAKFACVYERWQSGGLSQAEAGELVGKSERTFRRYKDDYEEGGLLGLKDGRLGRASSNATPAAVVASILALYRRDYMGWNVKHFHEHLVKRHGYAREQVHPEQTDRCVFEVFEVERGKLMEYRGAFDGFHSKSASVSKTCLVRFDANKYSVQSRAVGRPVDIHAYAERIVLKQDGIVVGVHARCFGRDQTLYDPWHYVPVLSKKPGALRNGAPFKDWPLPASLERVRRKLGGNADGDRQMVKVLTAVLTDGLAAVDAACAEALDAGLASADVILNALSRRQQAPAAPTPVATPDRLELTLPPRADCARYDTLRAPAPAGLAPAVITEASCHAGLGEAKLRLDGVPA